MKSIKFTNEEIDILLDALIYATTKMGRDNLTGADEIAMVKSLRANIKSQVTPEPTETPNPLDAHKLKIGSIVEMMYMTHANAIKPEWTIVDRHTANDFNGDVEMVTYKANCRVCNVTPKFFQVVIPHLNSMSVRYSKDVFTTTRHSYGNHGDFRPSIVQI
jgi:hypothetical protein